MENDLEQGETLFAEGKVDEAEGFFLERLTSHPDNAEVLNNLGVICHARKDVNKAREYFLKACENKDDYLDALLNLSSLYQETEQWEDAATQLEKCITLNPSEPNLHILLGRIYLEMDNSEKACVTLTRALELDSNQVAVREILDTLKNKKPASSVSTQTARRHPTVSIGMPVYNMVNTVQEAIDTILNQTFSDFELIISDNASDDGTDEICRAAAKKDSRVIYFRCPENAGGEVNFRRTLLLSTGKYFMWAAADDARRPEMVSRYVETLDEDPTAVLVYSHTELIDPATGARSLYYDSYQLDQDDLAERYTSLIKSLDLGNAIYGLYRRNVLITIPPLSNGSRFIFTDAVFLANVVIQGKVIQLPEKLFIRRRGKSKEWIDTMAFTERNTCPNYLSNGITLPVSESIQEHVRYLMTSALPVETKLRLIQITYETYVKRFGKIFCFEIYRAVNLAKEGKFAETWNGMPEPHPDEKVQDMIDQYYAGLLLDRLDRTSKFILNHKDLHLGKAFCLARMGRTREANLEITLSNELVTKKATVDEEPVFVHFKGESG